MPPLNDKPDLSKFFKDPDWHFVMEMLSRNLNGKDRIDTIDITQSAETIKAIVAGRQETLELINNFTQDIETYKKKTTISDNPVTFQ